MSNPNEPEQALAAPQAAEPAQVSEPRLAANRANAQKSTGPRTAQGKRIASRNARRNVRLLGLAEARALNQDLAAAERLYRDLVAPFEPCPAILARHFQDLARLCLELEAWERIRDAQLEHRWEQASIAARRLYQEMRRDLPGTIQEVFEGGLHGMPDSPAKWKKIVECLGALKDQITERNLDLEPVLHNLWGQKLNPKYARAQTICIRCERLMDPQGEPMTGEEIERLLDLLELELRDAQEAHLLELDKKTMTRAGCLATLGPTAADVAMDRQGERLRRAIDRKQWVITGLLQAFGLRPNFNARGSATPKPPAQQHPKAQPAPRRKTTA